jgi:N-acetylglucosamine kinase-like BadF-type ATPase
MMKEYVVGMDGGGTKTAVALLDLSGAELARYTAGPMNYNGVSAEVVQESFRQIFREIGREYPHTSCVSLCVACAGAGNPEIRARLEHNVRSCGYTARLSVVGDEQAALAGAVAEPRGMILIAGTGSICCGKNERGERCRSGGYGHLIDDVGSGYAIGRDILSAAVRSVDGRDGPTVLTDLLRTQADLDGTEQIVRFVYGAHTAKGDIASLARLLPEACRQGDKAALRIVEKSAHDLAELPVPVANKLGLADAKLALCGSILQKDPFIREAFCRHLQKALPSVTCVEPSRDAAAGAALMALEAVREQPAEL